MVGCVSTYTLTDAHRNIAQLVNEARYTDQPVIITDHGKPAAAFISPALLARYQALEAAADQRTIDEIRARGPRWTPDGEAQRLMDEIEAEVAGPER
jgi:prevent-host-death family protein